MHRKIRRALSKPSLLRGIGFIMRQFTRNYGDEQSNTRREKRSTNGTFSEIFRQPNKQPNNETVRVFAFCFVSLS